MACRVAGCTVCDAFVGAGSGEYLAESVEHGAHVGATILELPTVDYSPAVGEWIVANGVGMTAAQIAAALAGLPAFAHVP